MITFTHHEWHRLDCSGIAPTPRSDHAAAVVVGMMYVFGGRNDRDEKLGDLLALNLVNGRWCTFDDTSGAPGPRSGLLMSSHGSKIYVVGGETRNLSKEEETEMGMIYTLDTSKLDTSKTHMPSFLAPIAE